MMQKLWLILISGLILRLFLALFTFHPDIQVFDLSGYVLKNTDILNLYNYLYLLPQDSQVLKSYPSYVFNYPPLTYLFLGGVSLLLTSFIPPSIHTNFLFNVSQTLGNIYLSFHLLALKLPYLIFDLGCGFLLLKMFQGLRSKILVFSLWMFNPVNLYATYMMGQYDIIPTFFIMLALYLVHKSNTFKNLALAAVSLGMGASFKIFPILLLIPLAALLNSWMKRGQILVIGLLPYFLTTLPFWGSFGYRMNALLANQTDKIFYAQIPLSGGESIILFPALLLFIYFIFLYKKIHHADIWQNFFIVMLLFFIFTHYHPQWFLYLTPFLIIELVRSNFKNVLVTVAALLSWFALLFFFDSSLTIGLFAPLLPHLYQSPTLWQILGINIDYNFSRSILQTIFVGSALYFIYSYFPGKFKTA